MYTLHMFPRTQNKLYEIVGYLVESDKKLRYGHMENQANEINFPPEFMGITHLFFSRILQDSMGIMHTHLLNHAQGLQNSITTR